MFTKTAYDVDDKAALKNQILILIIMYKKL
jgi:hypothetical protein